jgi:hypothetical protein
MAYPTRTRSATDALVLAGRLKYPRPSRAQDRAIEAWALRCSKVRLSRPRSSRSSTSREPAALIALMSTHDDALKPGSGRPASMSSALVGARDTGGTEAEK